MTVAFYTQAVEKYRVRTSFRGDKDDLKDVSPGVLQDDQLTAQITAGC